MQPSSGSGDRDEQPTGHLVRLRPRPDFVYLSQGRTVLATNRAGFIAGGEEGLFVHETRMLSRYRYLINGREPVPVTLSNIGQHSWLGYYIHAVPQPPAHTGDPPGPTQDTLELRLSRAVGFGMHEDVDLTNFSQRSTTVRLELEIDGDFADVHETTSGRQQHGQLTHLCHALDGCWQLELTYRAEHQYQHQGNTGCAAIDRGLTVRIERAGSAPQYDGGRIRFAIELPAQGTWHACLIHIPRIERETLPVVYGCRALLGQSSVLDRRRESFLDGSAACSAPKTGTLTHVVIGALEQAKRDLIALRLYDLDDGEHAWTMAAGVPTYVALFGRDTLNAARRGALLSTDLLRGTLLALARRQGSERNDWRDEQPGRVLHEAHTGPLAMLSFNPHQRYYGSANGSALYPIGLVDLWRWTGDAELVRPLLEGALHALQWFDRAGDSDGDGLYEFRTRSEQGLKNQGWKDSGDAIVYEDGRQVPDPIATVEEQGYVYVAKIRFAQLLWALGQRAEAAQLRREAHELQRRFNERFWIEELGFFAMALDPHKRQVRSIASDPGHCLESGIIDDALARRTVSRLMADDLFSGWGIRTLSSRHPAYNPFSYHRGSVWPVEQATIALGLVRYGYHAEAQRLCRALFEAAALFDFYRLPEVFGGHQRDREHPFPALYPKSNWPQAWSSTAVFACVQALLGLCPYAPDGRLLLDPHLPEWLPEITLHRLRVGTATVTIRFQRESDGETGFDVLEQHGSLDVVRQPQPWRVLDSAVSGAG